VREWVKERHAGIPEHVNGDEIKVGMGLVEKDV